MLCKNIENVAVIAYSTVKLIRDNKGGLTVDDCKVKSLKGWWLLSINANFQN